MGLTEAKGKQELFDKTEKANKGFLQDLRNT